MMTHSGEKEHAVGDQGQRYEITVFDADLGRRIVYGWTDSKDDAEHIAAAVTIRHGWSHALVRDRKDNA